ncbi:FAD:protein FMN transferase [Phaeovulum sp.]|uniref:FAD:protein FMN transferase n=1 Tax=Phaeovulum sp. TaxID=2934796 RepID=UPI0039E23B9F
MIPMLNRRRFLTISAAALCLPYAAHAAVPVAEWHGTALGAGASLRLVGQTPAAAAPVFAAIETELKRLENIFSLHRAGSELSKLNRTGQLADPSAEMLELLTLAGAVHQATNGAFDPTVQPLWQLWAEGLGQSPELAELTQARALIGWDDVRISSDAIRFARPGMAMTLNGIAQGYITDRVAGLLRAKGFTDVLVDMGEIAALGQRPDGGNWEAGIATPEGQIVHRVQLRDRALATSAPLGTVLDVAGNVGHILNPKNGQPATLRTLVSVSAERAALADALSTAFCLMDDTAIAQAMSIYPEVRLEVS